MQANLDKVLKTLIKVLFFATPLVFITDANELYEFPKMYFVYVLGITIICLFLCRSVLYGIKIKLPKYYALLFLLSNIISTIASMHLYTSVWGYYTRFNGGFMSVLIFFVLYIVFYNLLTKKEYESILTLVLLGTFPISLYGFFQHFSLYNSLWGGVAQERVYSTFGQPNWLAAYLVMLLPFGYVKLLQTPVALLKLFWAAFFVLGFACVWFTYSMSGLLGLFIGVLLAIVLNLSLVKSKVGALASISVLLVCFFVAVTNLGIFESKVHDIFVDFQKVITLATPVYAQETTSVTANALSDPGFIRTGLWKGTLDLIFSSPKVFLIGTGPETFPYAFQPFRVPQLNYSSEWDFVFNKPHNYYLELWSQLGVVGLGLYLVLVAKIVRSSHKYLLPAVVSMLVTNFFGWPTVAVSLLFWFFLSIAEVSE